MTHWYRLTSWPNQHKVAQAAATGSARDDVQSCGAGRGGAPRGSATPSLLTDGLLGRGSPHTHDADSMRVQLSEASATTATSSQPDHVAALDARSTLSEESLAASELMQGRMRLAEETPFGYPTKAAAPHEPQSVFRIAERASGLSKGVAPRTDSSAEAQTQTSPSLRADGETGSRMFQSRRLLHTHTHTHTHTNTHTHTHMHTHTHPCIHAHTVMANINPAIIKIIWAK